MDMDQIADATAIFLNAARVGELNLLKQSEATLDQLVGAGIPAIFEKCKDGAAIHHAAIGGSVEILKYLVEEMKIEIDVKDNLGVTSLSLAAIEGNLAAVEYLLEMGANPEIPDHSNCTPLHHVALKGCKDAIALLLSKGIDVDITSELGSPLHFAALAGKHDNVQVLQE